MNFAVVEFSKGDKFQVPIYWLVDDNKFCQWPQDPNIVSKLIKSNTNPTENGNGVTWETFELRKVHKLGGKICININLSYALLKWTICKQRYIFH